MAAPTSSFTKQKRGTRQSCQGPSLRLLVRRQDQRVGPDKIVHTHLTATLKSNLAAAVRPCDLEQGARTIGRPLVVSGVTENFHEVPDVGQILSQRSSRQDLGEIQPIPFSDAEWLDHVHRRK